ncbi:hypothetical protein ES703_44035 [subsurface metagenome]
MPPPRFSVRNIQQTIQLTGYIIVVTTDVPCHLFMRWTLENPRTHKDPEQKRGAYFSARVRFCFVEYEDNEQEEAGDSWTHTFVKLGWPECQTRYFYFWGTVAGEDSPSESPLFEKHFMLPPMNGPYYLQLTDIRWAYGLRRQVSSESYFVCHDSPVASHIILAGDQQIDQAKLSASLYRVQRKPLYFDTSVIPDDAFIYGATLLYYISLTVNSVDEIHLFNAPELHDPPVLADYGYIRTLTSPILASFDPADIFMQWIAKWELNRDGVQAIVKDGLTKLALRTDSDVKRIAPVGTGNGIYPSAHPSRLIVTYYKPT